MRTVKTWKMWIGGEWVAARGGKSREIKNPADGSILAQVPEAGAEDVRAAVAAARRAFDEGDWGKAMARDRGTLLFKIAEALRARAAEFAETDSRNMGKP